MQPALVHTQFSPPLPDTHDSFNNAVGTTLSASGDGHFREQIANIRGSPRNPSSGSLLVCTVRRRRTENLLVLICEMIRWHVCTYKRKIAPIYMCTSTCTVARARHSSLRILSVYYSFSPCTLRILRCNVADGAAAWGSLDPRQAMDWQTQACSQDDSH